MMVTLSDANKPAMIPAVAPTTTLYRYVTTWV
jgi:hypothetical protein